MAYQKVIVRDIHGLPLVRHLVSATETTAYITDHQGLTELRELGHTMRQIGFPRSDVFQYDEIVVVKENQIVDWEELEMWSA